MRALLLPLLLTVGLSAFATPNVALAQQNPAYQQIQQRIRQYIQMRQRQQQRLADLVRRRNEQYRAAVKKQRDAYAAEVKKHRDAYSAQIDGLRKSGMTPEQILDMQRRAILSQVPRSSRSALERRWEREDRIRDRRHARLRQMAARTGKEIPADSSDLELGALEDLVLE